MFPIDQIIKNQHFFETEIFKFVFLTKQDQNTNLEAFLDQNQAHTQIITRYEQSEAIETYRKSAARSIR